MRNLPRFISRQMGKTISAGNLFNRNTPVFLPFYHVVSNEKLPHIHNYPYRNVEQFEAELDYFLTFFKPVSLKEIAEADNKKESIFHLSFDDGLRQCAEVIAPILKRKGVPATFFVNTAFVDNKQLFHKYKASLILGELNRSSSKQVDKLLNEYNLVGDSILQAEKSQENVLEEVAGLLKINFQKFLTNEQPYLSIQQVKELQKDGFTIGAHSFDHPEFYTITEEEQFEQVKKSMQWINEILHPEIKAFSFPFTDSGVSASLLKAIETENICDITFGTAGVKYDEFDSHFQRYPVEQPGSFVKNLKGEFVYFELRKLVGKATVKH